MEVKISLQAFVKNENGRLELVKRIDTDRIHNAYKLLDGYKLDELQVSATLTCEKDFKEMSDLLSVHKHCFWTPPQDEALFERSKLEALFHQFRFQYMKDSASDFFTFLLKQKK